MGTEGTCAQSTRRGLGHQEHPHFSAHWLEAATETWNDSVSCSLLKSPPLRCWDTGCVHTCQVQVHRAIHLPYVKAAGDDSTDRPHPGQDKQTTASILCESRANTQALPPCNTAEWFRTRRWPRAGATVGAAGLGSQSVSSISEPCRAEGPPGGSPAMQGQPRLGQLSHGAPWPGQRYGFGCVCSQD